MFDFSGGGLENNSAIPGTINEMLMQSYEGILRLFPAWDKKQDARFSGLRAFGAFLVDATLENGEIYAKIFSEKGMPLTLEAPGDGYVLKMEDGRIIPALGELITIDTKQGETVIVEKADAKRA